MPKPSYRPGQPSAEFERFTDREEQQAIFAQYLNMAAGEIPRLPALMFFGVGGIGKSWLLRFLQGRLAYVWRGVPAVRIDFTLEGASNRFRDDPSAALAAVREITKAECPRFDLALEFLQVRRGVRDESILDRPGRRTAVDAGNEFIKGVLGMIPGPGLTLQLCYSVLTKLYPQLRDKVRLNDLARLVQKDVQLLRDSTVEEIERTLGGRLAEDLRAETAFPLRSYKAVQAVVFIDTLEALEPLDASDSTLEIRTRWLRDLICELNDRVLFVLAGQNRLIWERFDPEWADSSWLEQNLVHGLSREDAIKFLISCGIEDHAVQEVMLAACLASEGGYHTFHLGLLADLVWVESQVNRRAVTPALFATLPAGDWTALALRFLKSLVDQSDADWIRKLALTAEFDEAAARATYSDQPSQAQETHWSMLKAFSFTLRSGLKAGWFTIHSAMQRAITEDLGRDPERIRQMHQSWYEYWRGRTKSPADGEAQMAWYHLWRLDPVSALEEWSRLAEVSRSVPRVNMALHHHLLAWWQPIQLIKQPTWNELEAQAANAIAFEYCRATLGDRGENLDTAISYCQRALTVFTREHQPTAWASTQNLLSNAYRGLPTGKRWENLKEAITCCRQALEIYTKEQYPEEWARGQNNLGIAISLISPDAKSQQEAITCYLRALEIYTRQEHPKEWARAQNNLGNAFRSMYAGDRRKNLSEAIACYNLALEVYTRADFPHEWARTQNNLGNAYRSLPADETGENLKTAISYYHSALEVHTRDAYPEDWARAQRNLAAVRHEKEAQDVVFEEAKRRADIAYSSAQYGNPRDARTTINSCRAYCRALNLTRAQQAEISGIFNEASKALKERVDLRQREWIERHRQWIDRQEKWIQRTQQKVVKGRQFVSYLDEKMKNLFEQLAKAPTDQIAAKIQGRIEQRSAKAAEVKAQLEKFEMKLEEAQSRLREAISRVPSSRREDSQGETESIPQEK